MYQKMIIVGFLGSDPEQKVISSGQTVTKFSVATNYEYTNKSGEKVKETTWFRVSVWGKKQADACNQYLAKGSKVLVEGRMTADKETGNPRIWEGSDGSARASFEITASTVRFLSSRQEATEAAQVDPDELAF